MQLIQNPTAMQGFLYIYLLATPILALIMGWLTTSDASTSPSLIIGGEKAKLGEFPFIVGIWVDGEFVCGGALVDQNVALVAAHCLREAAGGRIDPNRIQLLAGDHLLNVVESGEQLRDVKKVTFHSAKLNDLALVFPSRPFHHTDSVKWTNPSEIGGEEKSSLGTVIGWGRTDPMWNYTSPILQKVEVSVTEDDSSCSRADLIVGPNPSWTPLCTRTLNKAMICQGNSGNIFIGVGDAGKLIGLSPSIIESCGNESSENLFIPIPPYVGWLSQEIENNLKAMLQENEIKTRQEEEDNDVCSGEARRLHMFLLMLSLSITSLTLFFHQS